MQIMEVSFVKKITVDQLIIERVTIENILNKVVLIFFNFVEKAVMTNSEMNSCTNLIFVLNEPDYTVSNESDMNKKYNLNQ